MSLLTRRALVWMLALVAAASVEAVSASAQTVEEVHYYHTDGIGSVRMVTDQAGEVVSEHNYQPFGEEWLPPAGSDERVRFAGKELDPETGSGGWMALNYFGARYLHSATGRFTSPDPVVDIATSLTIPQRWNMYGYVLGNPIRYTDPDGRCVLVVADTIACAGAIITTGAVVKAAAATTLIAGAAWLGFATAEDTSAKDEAEPDATPDATPDARPDRDPIDQLDDIAEAQRNVRAGRGTEIIDTIGKSEQRARKWLKDAAKHWRDLFDDLLEP